jgi:hypothetical protein
MINHSRTVVAIFTIGIAACVDWRHDASLELNPAFTESTVTGKWRDGRAVLSLLPNGRFTCVGGGDCELLGRSGTWLIRDERELEFRERPDAAMFRNVVRYHGRYRLTQLDDDPDSWDGNLTFELDKPAT